MTWQCKKCKYSRYRVSHDSISESGMNLKRSVRCLKCDRGSFVHIRLFKAGSGRNIKVGKKPVSLKRYVWELFYGKKLTSEQNVHFKNLDNTDYRPANLMMIDETTIENYTVKCKKCGYSWIPKKRNPRKCPKCNSTKWKEV